MSQIHNLKLSQHGKSLGTREMGAKLRKDALDSIRKGNKVLFDFSNIEIISSAFADELFGKLFVELGEMSFKGNVKINKCFLYMYWCY